MANPRLLDPEDDLTNVVSDFDALVDGALAGVEQEPKVVDVPLDDSEMQQQMLADRAPLENEDELEAIRAKSAQEDDLAKTLSEYDKAAKADQLAYGINRAGNIWNAATGKPLIPFNAPSQTKAVSGKQDIINDRRALDQKGQPKPAKQESESVAEKNKSQAELNRAKAANEKLRPTESQKDRDFKAGEGDKNRQTKRDIADMQGQFKERNWNRLSASSKLQLGKQYDERIVPGKRFVRDQSGNALIPSIEQHKNQIKLEEDHHKIDIYGNELIQKLEANPTPIKGTTEYAEIEETLMGLAQAVNKYEENGVMNIHDLVNVEREIGSVGLEQWLSGGGQARIGSALRKWNTVYPGLSRLNKYEPGEEQSRVADALNQFSEGQSSGSSVEASGPVGERGLQPERVPVVPLDKKTGPRPPLVSTMEPKRSWTVTDLDSGESFEIDDDEAAAIASELNSGTEKRNLKIEGKK